MTNCGGGKYCESSFNVFTKFYVAQGYKYEPSEDQTHYSSNSLASEMLSHNTPILI